MQKLSIVIPTYNRREKLLRQLHAIFAQPESKNVDVTVLDNHSEYNCEESVYNDFPKELYPNLRVITHPYNIGGNMNISLCFYYATGDWLWMMSDDDVVNPDSLKTIFHDIMQYKEYIVLKYSLDMGIAGFSYSNNSIDSLNGFIDYCEQDNVLLGNLIFISTGVFNLNRLKPVLGTIIEYGYDSMSAINPIIIGLDNEIGRVFFSDKCIITRENPNDMMNQGWSMNYHYIIGRTVSILDYPFKSDGNTIRRVLSLNKDWNIYKIAKSLFSLNDKVRMKIFHDRTYKYFYKGKRRLKAEFIFYCFYLFNFDVKERRFVTK
jgi:glycosyltransferase involved in cell wall biosynthesis